LKATNNITHLSKNPYQSNHIPVLYDYVAVSKSTSSCLNEDTANYPSSYFA